MECVSCRKNSSIFVKFPCPNCGASLARCGKCRSLSKEYKCLKCEHEGP